MCAWRHHSHLDPQPEMSPQGPICLAGVVYKHSIQTIEYAPSRVHAGLAVTVALNAWYAQMDRSYV